MNGEPASGGPESSIQSPCAEGVVPKETGPDMTRWCFGCGADNPIGLHLHFQVADDGVVGAFTPSPEHQGWDSVVHGGIVMTVLDEALAYAAYYAAGPTVTAALETRLRRPCRVGQRLTVEARIVSNRHRPLQEEARLVDEDGEAVAEARGKFVLCG